MIIIGIETSCDDTSIAIIKNGKVLANVTSSSTRVHEQYGGIVPELAARKHCTNIDKVFQHAIKIAKIKPNDVDYVAYTSEPGLIGSLHVGKVFAKQLAALLGVKIIQVNHLLAHIFSYFLDHDIKNLKFPFLSVVVSGGHTFIAINYSVNKYRILNSSIDDACGETLDKIGRLLKLPYPGGISIDKIYNSKKVFDLIKHSTADKEFSFSGLKTAVSNLINNLRQKKKKIDTIGIASSSLKWIIDDLEIKIKYYLNKYPKTKMILFGGGVSANSLLRKTFTKWRNTKFLFPTMQYTNDNAAMVALWAFLLLKYRGKEC